LKPIRKVPALTIAAVAALALMFCCRAQAQEMAEDVLNAKDIKIREDYAIVVDGVTLEPDVPPLERGGVIFIPLRFAAEALRASVTWDRVEKTAEIGFSNNTKIKMTVGNPVIEMGEKEKILPVAPFIFEGRMMIPLRQTAESGIFRVEERKNATLLTSEQEDIKGYTEPGIESVEGGNRTSKALALNDQITKAMTPYVKAAWAIAGLLWVAVTVLGLMKGRPDGWKDQILIFIILTVGVYLITTYMYSTYWAAIVAIGTGIVGMVSKETYTEKLVTMASSAQGLGLICTLFGLGLLIGPAIAERDIAAIGYGIYVKIEPTITGLTLSIILNMLYGYEARKNEITSGG